MATAPAQAESTSRSLSPGKLGLAACTALVSGSDERLYHARIAGNRIRYTLEFFADALGPDVTQVLTPLTALQECLGTLQNDVTAQKHVAALADDPGA